MQAMSQTLVLESTPPVRVLLVTRHPGALQWLRARLDAPGARHVQHLESLEGLQAGDTVAGNLPLELAAALCARGVVVLGIDLPLAAHQRGVPLGAAAMQAAGACLRRYLVSAEPWPEGLHRGATGPAHERLLATGKKPAGRID